MPNPEYRAFGGSDMSKAATANGGNWTDMFNDPNFINFLAGTGARMDPEGVGGALGGATQEWVQGQQMGKAMEKQGDLMERLLEALAGGKIGKANVAKDGSVKLEAAPKVAEDGDMSLNKPLAQSNFGESVPVFGEWMSNMQKRIQQFESTFAR